MHAEFEDRDYLPERVEQARKDMETLQEIGAEISNMMIRIRKISQQMGDRQIIDELQVALQDAAVETIGRLENNLADFIDDYDAMQEAAARFRDRAAYLDRVL